jgi:hypothetical protein
LAADDPEAHTLLAGALGMPDEWGLLWGRGMGPMG